MIMFHSGQSIGTITCIICKHTNLVPCDNSPCRRAALHLRSCSGKTTPLQTLCSNTSTCTCTQQLVSACFYSKTLVYRFSVPLIGGPLLDFQVLLMLHFELFDLVGHCYTRPIVQQDTCRILGTSMSKQKTLTINSQAIAFIVRYCQ